jgi:hypothetical protein
MRISLGRIAVALMLGSIVSGSAAAQEQSVQQMLADVNTMLRENSYVDDMGQVTFSHVALGDSGTLVVEVTKAKGTNQTTNVYEVHVADLSAGRFQSRNRGDYTSLSLGAKGPIVGRLRCVTGVSDNTWNLPAPTEVAVEFKSNPDVGRSISQALARLITAAQQRGSISTT